MGISIRNAETLKAGRSKPDAYPLEAAPSIPSEGVEFLLGPPLLQTATALRPATVGIIPQWLSVKLTNRKQARRQVPRSH